MLVFGVSNAVLVRARSMYARRLKEDDFKSLFACENVSQVVSFFKFKANYSNKLVSVDEKIVHRDVLESILREDLYNDLAILAKYDLVIGEHFFNYVISKIEIINILRFLIFLKSNQTNEYNFRLPKFILKHTKIDFNKLSKVKSYSGFLNSLSNSIYYENIKKLKYSNTEEMDINKIETLFYSCFFENFIKLVDFDLPKNVAGKIKKFKMNYIDALNLVRIVRLKKNYKVDKEYILSLMFNVRNYNFKKIERIILSENIDEALRGLEIYNFKKNFNIDQFPVYMKFKWAKKNIVFSKLAPVVFISYIFLKEIEISNVINIIEGKRYKLENEKIGKMLIR